MLTRVKCSLIQRLLIPSAETLSIVQCYVRTIKTLLYLDPSAVLLTGVSPTLAEYLQQNRPDTLRTIVTQLTQAALSDDPEAAQSDLLLSELQKYARSRHQSVTNGIILFIARKPLGKIETQTMRAATKKTRTDRGTPSLFIFNQGRTVNLNLWTY